MTEWLKVPVLKTGVGTPYRGFESHSLRHIPLTRTLGSNSAAEGFTLYDSTTHDKLYLHSHTELLHILVSLYTIQFKLYNIGYYTMSPFEHPQQSHTPERASIKPTPQNAMSVKKHK